MIGGRPLDGGHRVGGPVARHASRTITWSAPAAGIESSAATNPPNRPPTHDPIDAPTRTEMRTSSGLMRTVLLMMTGFSTWFSNCV